MDFATLASASFLSREDRRDYLNAMVKVEKRAKALRDVSYWVEAERYWQFAGSGDAAWAADRARYLRDYGHKVRVRLR